MAAGYYKRFQVVRIDVDGVSTPLASDSLDVDNITTSSSIGTVDTDAEGFVDATYFTGVTPGDVVEFSHATYPGLFRLTLGSSQADAQLRDQNGSKILFIVENLFVDVTASDNAFAYVTDLNQPNLPRQFIGKVETGTNLIPYLKPNKAQNLRVSLVSQSGERQLTTQDLSQAEFDDVDIPAAAPAIQTLFAFPDDAGSTSGGLNLYIGTIPDHTYDAEGAVVREYVAGEFATNGNTKTFDVTLDGNNIFTNTGTKNGGAWFIAIHTMRSSSDELKCHVTLTYPGADPFETYTDGVVVDFDSPLLLTVKGTSTATNDIIAHYAYAERLSAPPAEVTYLLGGGVILRGGGESLTG